MDLANVLTEIAPALVFGGGLLWNFSKQITKIDAQIQALEHRVSDCKGHIEGNRQGRIEVFGVINNTLKPKDNELSERLARVEERLNGGADLSEIYQELATLKAELKCSKKEG